MSNWIVTVAHNNLDLTKSAIESFLAQDIGNIKVLVVNNESFDGTAEWLAFANRQFGVESIHIYPQIGVAYAWNRALQYLFDTVLAERVLVCNNDVVLRPETYRLLDCDGGGFVTAVGSHDPASVGGPASGVYSVRPNPDFSCFMVRKETYLAVGPFDENFKIAFAEDWDYHVRLHAAGVFAYCIDVPFLHVGGGSQTMKRASDSEARRISEQAAKNRAYFASKYGFEGGSPEYYAYFKSLSSKAGPQEPAPATHQQPLQAE